MNRIIYNIFHKDKIPKTYDDPTGIILSPANPKKCLGNGEHIEYECCCDECDWYLACFPNWKKEMYK